MKQVKLGDKIRNTLVTDILNIVVGKRKAGKPLS